MRAAFLLLPAILLGAESARSQEPDFRTDVRPLLQQFCFDCHGADSAEGDVRLHELSSGAFADDVDLWATLTEKLLFGEMPPPEADQPGFAEKRRLGSWVAAQLRRHGRTPEWERKLQFPEYGNLIDHTTLFDGSVSGPAWSPSRIWKKSDRIFDSLAQRGIGFRPGRYGALSPQLSKVKQPFTLEDRAGIRDFAAIAIADSATLSTLLRNAEAIVDKHLGEVVYELDGPIPEDQLPKDKKGKPIRPRFPKTPAEFRAVAMNEGMPTADMMDAAIVRMSRLMIEREPTDESTARFRELMRRSILAAGNVEGLRVALVAVAVSPPVIYRMELGQGAPDEHGRVLLGPANLAFAIAYGLTDQPPDAELLSAAREGRLSSKADVVREVARIWDDPEIAKPRVLRFFHEFFGYHRAPQVFKDQARFGRDYDRAKVAEQLVKDADTLVMHIVEQDTNVLATLLTSDRYFVGHTGDNEQARTTNEALTQFYDYLEDKGWQDFEYKTPQEHVQYVRKLHRMFSHPNGNVVKRWMRYLEKCRRNEVTPVPMINKREFLAAWDLDEATFNYPLEQPFALAPDRRVGLLMHPAWLIAHSLNVDNDPIRRGKWVRERLLADAVPELPITVDATIPEEPDHTLRRRLRVTREAECWRCHEKMNPLGMPFELFDDFGRYRKREKLMARGKSAPVDSSGFLQGTRNATLDGAVDGPHQLVTRLARSRRVRESFVRHAFRYWMGRNETLRDSPSLIAADRAYQDNDGSFRALVISLLSSDSFLYRKRTD